MSEICFSFYLHESKFEGQYIFTYNIVSTKLFFCSTFGACACKSNISSATKQY